MHALTRLTLALAVGTASPFAFADDNVVPLSPAAAAAHEAAVIQHHARRMPGQFRQAASETAASTAASDPANPKAVTASSYPGTPHANGWRAYPPSCGANPLPDQPSGPILASKRIPLYARNSGTGQTVAETVTFTVWRIACSSSGDITPYNGDGGGNAMTLIRFQRDAGANPNYYVTFPLITIGQSGSDITRDSPRIAIEPNTVMSDMSFSSPFTNGVTFVLENYPGQGTFGFAFSYKFDLRVDPVLDNVAPITVEIPGYYPQAGTYPDAFNPLPFDGYAAAQWKGKTRPDDGLIVQIPEVWSGEAGHRTWSRQIVFDLLTRDNNGDPFWLVGNTLFDEGAIGITTDVYYLGKNNALTRWGKAAFTFQHCNRMDVKWTPNAGLPASVPVISGVNEFERLFAANGMLCE